MKGGKKETLGQQLVDKIEKNKGQKFAEVREVSEEYSKVFWKEIEGICSKKEYMLKKQIYITVVGKKEAGIDNMTHVKYIITDKITDPTWSSTTFKYTPLTETLEMVRIIGTPILAMQMKQSAEGEGWNKQLYHDTMEYFKAEQGNAQILMSAK